MWLKQNILLLPSTGQRNDPVRPRRKNERIKKKQENTQRVCKIVPTLRGQSRSFVVSVSFASSSPLSSSWCSVVPYKATSFRRPCPPPFLQSLQKSKVKKRPTVSKFLRLIFLLWFPLALNLSFMRLVGWPKKSAWLISLCPPNAEHNFLTFTAHWAWKVTHTGTAWQLTGKGYQVVRAHNYSF